MTSKERVMTAFDHKEPDLVRLRTREIVDTMKPGDGFVAGASHDSILEETPVENVLTMFDTIEEYGKY